MAPGGLVRRGPDPRELVPCQAGFVRVREGGNDVAELDDRLPDLVLFLEGQGFLEVRGGSLIAARILVQQVVQRVDGRSVLPLAEIALRDPVQGVVGEGTVRKALLVLLEAADRQGVVALREVRVGGVVSEHSCDMP